MNRILIALLAASFLAACGQSPTDTYVNMSTAARLGDREAFLAGFTEDSRRIVKGLTSLSEAYGFKESDPYTKFVFDKVIKEEKFGEGEDAGSYTCDVPCAVITVERSGKSGKKGGQTKILMLETDDGYLIDLAAQEEFWKKNK